MEGRSKTGSAKRAKIAAKRVRSISGHGADIVGTYVKMVGRASPMHLIDLEREGVPGVLIRDLGDRIEVPRTRFYSIIGAPRATVERKVAEKAKVSGAAGQATLAVVRLLATAQQIVKRSTAESAKAFDTERWLGRWLDTSQPALGGRKPADLLDTPTGQELVMRVLGALESGSYQ
jgi:putative toxin-antitoxin system antitoxin component (TIGR02293 family)